MKQQEKIKEKVLKQGKELPFFSGNEEKLVDLTIQETTKQIFEDIGKNGYVNAKKKWLK